MPLTTTETIKATKIPKNIVSTGMKAESSSSHTLARILPIIINTKAIAAKRITLATISIHHLYHVQTLNRA